MSRGSVIVQFEQHREGQPPQKITHVVNVGALIYVYRKGSKLTLIFLGGHTVDIALSPGNEEHVTTIVEQLHKGMSS